MHYRKGSSYLEGRSAKRNSGSFAIEDVYPFKEKEGSDMSNDLSSTNFPELSYY